MTQTIIEAFVLGSMGVSILCFTAIMVHYYITRGRFE